MECGRYLDKILVDTLDHKAGFPLAIVFIQSNVFHRKQQEVGLDPTFFTLKVASFEKICKWKTGLIGQANGSTVVYLSAEANAGPFKGQFPLVY